MKKDVVSKEILKDIVIDVAKYILKLEIKDVEFIDSEKLRVESRRADIVAKIDNNYILHLEIQNNNDYSMPYRMARYYLDIKKDNKLPIKQFVIYIGKEKLYMKSNINEENMNYSYNLIDIRNIDCEFLLKEDTPDALVLAVLCDFKDKNPKDVVKYIIERLSFHTQNDLYKFRKYLVMLEELSDNRDLRKVVKEQEMLSEIKLENLPSYEIGYERGIEQGVEKAVRTIYIYEPNPKKIAKSLEIDEKVVLRILNDKVSNNAK